MNKSVSHQMNQRSGRDSNPRYPLQGTPAFQASTFSHSVTTPIGHTWLLFVNIREIRMIIFVEVDSIFFQVRYIPTETFV